LHPPSFAFVPSMTGTLAAFPCAANSSGMPTTSTPSITGDQSSRPAEGAAHKREYTAQVGTSKSRAATPDTGKLLSETVDDGPKGSLDTPSLTPDDALCQQEEGTQGQRKCKGWRCGRHRGCRQGLQVTATANNNGSSSSSSKHPTHLQCRRVELSQANHNTRIGAVAGAVGDAAACVHRYADKLKQHTNTT
jgi:hypothetical protein